MCGALNGNNCTFLSSLARVEVTHPFANKRSMTHAPFFVVGSFTLDLIIECPTTKPTNLLLSLPELFLRDSKPYLPVPNPHSELITAGIPTVGIRERNVRIQERREFLNGGGTDSCNCPSRDDLTCRCEGKAQSHDDEEEHPETIHETVLTDQSTMGIPPLAVAELAALPHTTYAKAKQPNSNSNFSRSSYDQ